MDLNGWFADQVASYSPLEGWILYSKDGVENSSTSLRPRVGVLLKRRMNSAL